MKKPEHAPGQPPETTGNSSVNDFLAREYLPVIKQFPEAEVQRSLLRESAITRICVKDPSKQPPSAPVSDAVPAELEFLAGSLCELGFERLDLSQTELERLYLAFCSGGVAIPGTPYRLRHSVMSLFTFVEPATGKELKLPDNWREAVRTHRWIGKRTTPPLDRSMYEDVGDGYMLRAEVYA
ncbi:MAG TPA: hypothetical protein VFI31_03770 [Pirellulales bacterium]|nr:hypothetical protein [Pirellulales bacterium]